MTFITACNQAMLWGGGIVSDGDVNVYKVTNCGEVYYVDGHNVQYGDEWRVIEQDFTKKFLDRYPRNAQGGFDAPEDLSSGSIPFGPGVII